MPIYFFSEDTDFSLQNVDSIKNWLSNIIKDYEYSLGELNYIFCSDQYLHSLNKQYLNHDTLTDIITFDNSDQDRVINSDIFISIERVKDNALTYSKNFQSELQRVLVHGLLHLFGFEDKTKRGKEDMRKNEEACLSLLPEIR